VGLPHQLQALSLFPTSSLPNFQQYLNDFSSPLPFLMPDVSHVFQLSLKKAAEESALPLKNYLDDIDNLASKIRKKSRCYYWGKLSYLPSYQIFLLCLIQELRFHTEIYFQLPVLLFGTQLGQTFSMSIRKQQLTSALE
jgi:hypothetical protein